MPKTGGLLSPNRHMIDLMTRGKKSQYGQEVRIVNEELDKRGIDISDRSMKSVIDNVQKVESGERSEINAHQREALTFARDAVESLSQRKYRQGLTELLGSVLNTGGSFFKASYTPTPLEKKGVDPY